MNSIKKKLNLLTLSDLEKDFTKGTGRQCCCACAYEFKGGSDSDTNLTANYHGGKNGLVSPECHEYM